MVVCGCGDVYVVCVDVVCGSGVADEDADADVDVSFCGHSRSLLSTITL